MFDSRNAREVARLRVLAASAQLLEASSSAFRKKTRILVRIQSERDARRQSATRDSYASRRVPTRTYTSVRARERE